MVPLKKCRRGSKVVVGDALDNNHKKGCKNEAYEETEKKNMVLDLSLKNFSLDEKRKKRKMCKFASQNAGVGIGEKNREKLKRCTSHDHTSGMCEDILTQIILQLPWDSVTRFKTVSKEWLRLISEPSFTPIYVARNLSLLGFFYNENENELMNYISLGSPEVLKRRHIGFVVSSCDSLNLHMRVPGQDHPFLFIHNPITDHAVRLPTPPPIIKGNANRFVVYGLATDLFSSHQQHLTVAELTDGPVGLQVNMFSSKKFCWETKEHNIQPFLGENYILLGQSTYLNGALHWLLEPSGIIAYDIKSECFSFNFLGIPGDKVDGCYICMKVGEIDYPGTVFGPLNSCSKCRCRYLGESQKRLLYIRIIGDFEIDMWTLNDYYLGAWSQRQPIVLQRLPVSLACGRILAADPKDSNHVFIRLKDKIYSYHLEIGELKVVHTIKVESCSTKRCISAIVPYKLPRSPPSVPPDYWFSVLFGNSLCFKGTCGIEAIGNVHLDAHLHDRTNQHYECEDSFYGHVARLSFMSGWSELLGEDSF